MLGCYIDRSVKLIIVLFDYNDVAEVDPPEDSKELCNLPDCVKSYIFSKLTMKDLVRTSTLSKKWHNEIWGSRMDLNFHLLNMFGSNEIEKHKYLSSCLVLHIGQIRSEFVKRVDKFMRRCRSAKIDKFRLHFPLGNKHKDALDRWISQAISKGAESIELLLLNDSDTYCIKKQEPYEFPCTLLSKCGPSSIKYLHLQNCILVPPVGFSGFKKLTNLVLEKLVVEHDLLHCLFSTCLHLEDLTFKLCHFNCDLKIISPTLHHLKILNFGSGQFLDPGEIDIVALNLSSFEYSASNSLYSVKLPQLMDFCLDHYHMPPFDFSRFKKLRTLVLEHVLVGQDRLLCLLSECFNLEGLTIMNCHLESDIHVVSPTLLHLNIINCRYYPKPWKIDIDALNLSSLEYRGEIRMFSIKAPKLLKSYLNATDAREIPRAFALIANLHRLESLTIHLDRFRVSQNSRNF